MIDAHRIAPKLWVGSYPESPAVCNLFDVVVLCARGLQTLPYTGPRILHAPLNDSKPTDAEIRIASDAAVAVHVLRRRGSFSQREPQRVLVTCAAGLNRSALVAAMALILDGDSAEQAIARVRANRKSPSGYEALNNGDFVRFLHSWYRAFREGQPLPGRLNVEEYGGGG
jgi:protein-tyrosine phosphatase